MRMRRALLDAHAELIAEGGEFFTPLLLAWAEAFERIVLG